MAKIPLESEHKLRLESQALRYFHRVKRPLLLGEVSLWINMQLDRTEEVLDSLVEKKHIRKMSKEEMIEQGLGDRNYYEVVGRYDISLTEDKTN